MTDSSGPAVLVVGSLNTDLTVRTDRLPRPGETVAGSPLATLPGGKGANQAVAAARLGARVEMVGAVGADGHGEMLLGALRAAGVGTRHVRRLPGTATGSALIVVDRAGENTIVVSPGANGELLPEHAEPFVAGAGVLCLCLEIPLPTVLAAARAGRECGTRVVLNLSPAMAVPRELLAATDVLLVNGHEAAELLGLDAEPRDWRARADDLRRAGVGEAVVTLGAAGAVVFAADGRATAVPAPAVTAVDTTGCGDAFTGALAARLAADDGLVPAARVACAVAALAATRTGAQNSYPSAEEAAALLPGPHGRVSG